MSSEPAPIEKNTVDQNTFRLAVFLSFLISGLSVGWLIGLSVSPVIQTVVTSLLTLIVGAVSVIAGLREKEATITKFPKVQLYPILTTIVGIALGASLGVVGRTNGWLGPNLNKIVDQWEAVGLQEREVALRLLDSVYPPAEPSKKSSESMESEKKKPEEVVGPTLRSSVTPALFSEVSPDQCKRLRAASEDQLSRTMMASPDERIRKLAQILEKYPQSLNRIVKELLCPDPD